jgi:hypothetical protein
LIVADGFVGAAFWLYDVLSWVSILMVTCIILFDHLPTSFLGYQQYEHSERKTTIMDSFSKKHFSLTRWIVENWSLTRSIIFLFVVLIGFVVLVIVTVENLGVQKEIA